MDFEWDEAKRKANITKHGLDFADAGEFEWEGAITYPDSRWDYGEVREIAFAIFRGRVHVIVYAIRNGRTRLINFRKANAREIRRYEAEKAQSE